MAQHSGAGFTQPKFSPTPPPMNFPAQKPQSPYSRFDRNPSTFSARVRQPKPASTGRLNQGRGQ